MARQLSTHIAGIIITATIAMVGTGTAAIAVTSAAAPAATSHAVAYGPDNTPWG